MECIGNFKLYNINMVRIEYACCITIESFNGIFFNGMVITVLLKIDLHKKLIYMELYNFRNP